MKRINIIRIINSLVLFAGLGFAIFTGLNSDGQNRYWEGKAFGGALAIIGVTMMVYVIIAINVYKKTKKITDVQQAWKEMSLMMVSYDWPKALFSRKR